MTIMTSISRSSSSSESLPCRLRTGTPAGTPLIPSPRAQPFLRAELELAVEFRARLLAMDKVAEPAAHAALATVQPAARLAKVGDGREFAVYRPCRVPARIERVAGLLGRVFVFEACVHVAYQVF